MIFSVSFLLSVMKQKKTPNNSPQKTHNVEDDDDDGHVVAGVPAELFQGSRTAHIEDLLAQFGQHSLQRWKMTMDDVA